MRGPIDLSGLPSTDLSAPYKPFTPPPPSKVYVHPLWGSAPLSSKEVDTLVERVVRSTNESNLLDHLEFISNKPKWVRYTPAVNKAFQTLMQMGKKSKFIEAAALKYAEAETGMKYETLRDQESALFEITQELIRHASHLKQVVSEIVRAVFEDHSENIRSFQKKYDSQVSQHNENVRLFNARWEAFKKAYLSYEYEGEGFTLRVPAALEDMRIVSPVGDINLMQVAESSMREDSMYWEDQARTQRKRLR